MVLYGQFVIASLWVKFSIENVSIEAHYHDFASHADYASFA
jgi:hypothetical protein